MNRAVKTTALLGVLALLTVAAVSTVAADENGFTRLEASYDGTFVNVVGNIDGKDAVTFDVCGTDGTTMIVVGFTVPGPDGSFQVSIRATLPVGNGYVV
ncbi:MAG: hypothetical protein LBB30_01840, partial [Candidatus Methanoplasma sp.]|nr:hypothetical protein [Candidatus Methanoplasma sp.]